MTTFKPDWLRTAAYIPILVGIFEFTKQHKIPPTISVLHEFLSDSNKEVYESRLKPALDTISQSAPDVAQQIYTLSKARSYAICRTLETLQTDQAFMKMQMDGDGDSALRYVQSMIAKFNAMEGDKTLDLEEATQVLLMNGASLLPNERIQTGIEPIDVWCGGGLKRKNLGIIMAPTGHGKTVCLVFIGTHIAGVEEKKVWYVTNELPIEEIAERAISKISGVALSEIMEDAATGYTEHLNRLMTEVYKQNMLITEVNRQINTMELEAQMTKWISLTGWKPDVIVLDYMERMKPNEQGLRRDQSWAWQGAIAQDLVRLAKRHNILVWTAIQTNRSGLNSPVLDSSMAQGSIQHLQEAAAVVAMLQRDHPTDENKKAMEFRSLKMRHSPKDGKSVILEADLRKMTITRTEVKIEEIDRSQENDDDDDDSQKQTYGRNRNNKRRKSNWT